MADEKVNDGLKVEEETKYVRSRTSLELSSTCIGLIACQLR